MRSAGDRRALCTGNSGSETIGDAVDIGDVVVAGQYQSRDLNVAESLRRGRLEVQHPHVVVSLLLPEGLSLHLADELARCGIHVIETAMRTGKPDAQIRVDCSIQISAFERRFF